MKAEIIGIGTEILLGEIVNTNSALLSRKLAGIGVDVYYHSTVGDNKKRLYEFIKTALKRSDIVITTGGLGPTIDDVTLETVAEVLEKPLILEKGIADLIDAHFKKRHIKMPQNNLRQAYIPKGATWLRNNIGTAPGLVIKIGRKSLIALPGPPHEMIPMLDSYVLPMYEFARNPYLFADDKSAKMGFGEARHDQTLFSILAHKLGMTIQPEGLMNLKFKDGKSVEFHATSDRRFFTKKTNILVSRFGATLNYQRFIHYNE